MLPQARMASHHLDLMISPDGDKQVMALLDQFDAMAAEGPDTDRQAPPTTSAVPPLGIVGQSLRRGVWERKLWPSSGPSP